MALLRCPECNRHVSERAPNCPHCGYPLARTSPAARPRRVVIQLPQAPAAGAGFGKLVALLIAVVAAAFLAFTNPTEADMRAQLARDGWAPVGFERTNLVVLNWVSVTGFTGARAKYLGIAGQVVKVGGD
jgi:hypothetical protein